MKVFEGFTNIFKSDDYDDDDYVNEEDYIDDDDYEVPKREQRAKRDKSKEKKSSFFGSFKKSYEDDKDDVSSYYDDEADADTSYSQTVEHETAEREPVKRFASAGTVPDRASQPKVEAPRERKVVPLRNSSAGGFEVVVIHAESMEDGNEITDTLLSGKAVVLNLEGINPDVAQRIIDYSAGSCYAMRGNLQKISNYIFLVAPSGVDISGDFQRALNPHADLSSYGNDFNFN